MSSVRSRSAGHAQCDRVDPEVEVLAQPAVLERGLDVDVGRADQPEVHADDAIAADRPVLALLQHPQQLRLQVRRHLADLVEQQRAALRLLEQAVLVAVRARERAAAIAEQLRLDQVLRNRGAVDLDEGALRAPAVVVQRVGDELLAGAVLALDEDVGLGVGHGGHQIEQLAHLPAAADDVVELVAIAQLPLERDVLGSELHALDRAPENREHALAVDRLFQEIRGAGFHRLDGARDAALPADDQHLGAGTHALELPDEVSAVGVWQHEVDERDVGHPAGECLFSFGAPNCDTRVVAGPPRDVGQPLRHIRLVVNDEHAAYPV